MAKKNSSKTATEKAIQSSEPRVITFRGWQGVNFVDAPLTWHPLETSKEKFNQTDLPDNFLMVQNNVNTTDTLGLETRMSSIRIKDNPEDYKFTGISAIYKHWIFLVARKIATPWHERIFYRSLKDPVSTDWIELRLKTYNASQDVNDPENCEICEIGFFESNIVATVRNHTDNSGFLALASISVNEAETQITIRGRTWPNGEAENFITDTPKICPDTNRPKPSAAPNILLPASADMSISYDTTGFPHRYQFCFCYTNRLGSTLVGNSREVGCSLSAKMFSSKNYLIIKPSSGDDQNVISATGVDIYALEDENTEYVFIGHVETTPDKITNGTWSFNWYGAMTDITQWATAQLKVPTDNTTHGPDATHFASHDSRLYFWGMPSKPYRLWVGGNPGAEFSVARGLGGAWVDIEPGSGYDIKGTAKWKTTQGANIVTILCGNRNTTKVERFNLVETNTTFTNEESYKSYMYEQVSNVVGCNSRYGFGVYDEGLYTLNRYGLMLTTMASEYNNQMKNQKMSDVIDPIFTNALGKQLSDGRMVYINGIIYIALSEDENATGLGNVIFCYDTKLKAWYTWTHDQSLTDPDPDKILHIFAIDSDECQEGLGVITETEVRLYPVTGEQEATVPDFQVLLETGELAPRQPMQAYWYIQQLEFRFDYFIGNPNNPATILVEGVDYYGRYFIIEKKLNYKQRGWTQYNDNGLPATIEQRNYTEWIRIDKVVQSFRIRLKGHARFRLTHINARVYQQSDTISTPYGFDASDTGYNARGKEFQIHHYIDDYNNLRRAVVS